MARADMFMSDLHCIIIRNVTLVYWTPVCRCDGFVVACGTGGWLRGSSRCHRRLLGRHYDNVNNQWIQFRHVIHTQALLVWCGFRHRRHWRFHLQCGQWREFCVESIFVCIYHWYFTMSNIFIIDITLSSEFWIYMFMSVWRICRRLWHCGLSLWQPARRRQLSDRYYDDVIPSV